MSTVGKHVSLDEAVAHHVQPGDTVCVAMGHHRWTAAARELCRQHWRADPGFTLVMPSLGSLGVLFVHGGLVRRTVTAYSGDAFPTYSRTRCSNAATKVARSSRSTGRSSR